MAPPSSRPAALAVVLLLAATAWAPDAATGELTTFAVPTTPVLEPWRAGSSATFGSSTLARASVGTVELGPCVYREWHWHATTWEVATLFPGSPRIISYVMGRTGNVTAEDVTPGSSVLYPEGWAHAQFNNNCKRTAKLSLVFGDRDVPTHNLVQQVASLPLPYLRTAIGHNITHDSFWLVDKACAKRCGITV